MHELDVLLVSCQLQSGRSFTWSWNKNTWIETPAAWYQQSERWPSVWKRAYEMQQSCVNFSSLHVKRAIWIVSEMFTRQQHKQMHHQHQHPFFSP